MQEAKTSLRLPPEQDPKYRAFFEQLQREDLPVQEALKKIHPDFLLIRQYVLNELKIAPRTFEKQKFKYQGVTPRREILPEMDSDYHKWPGRLKRWFKGLISAEEKEKTRKHKIIKDDSKGLYFFAGQQEVLGILKRLV